MAGELESSTSRRPLHLRHHLRCARHSGYWVRRGSARLQLVRCCSQHPRSATDSSTWSCSSDRNQLQFLPLFYVGTACFYMVFSVPAGVLADRYRAPAGAARRLRSAGRRVRRAAVHAANRLAGGDGLPGSHGPLLRRNGRHSDGARQHRTTAGAAHERPRHDRHAIGIGKLVSSVVFGWVWAAAGQTVAIVVIHWRTGR